MSQAATDSSMAAARLAREALVRMPRWVLVVFMAFEFLFFYGIDRYMLFRISSLDFLFLLMSVRRVLPMGGRGVIDACSYGEALL